MCVYIYEYCKYIIKYMYVCMYACMHGCMYMSKPNKTILYNLTGRIVLTIIMIHELGIPLKTTIVIHLIWWISNRKNPHFIKVAIFFAIVDRVFRRLSLLPSTEIELYTTTKIMKPINSLSGTTCSNAWNFTEVIRRLLCHATMVWAAPAGPSVPVPINNTRSHVDSPNV